MSQAPRSFQHIISSMTPSNLNAGGTLASLANGGNGTPGPSPATGSGSSASQTSAPTTPADPLYDKVMARRRPLALPPVSMENALFYWSGASEAELRRFLEDNIDKDLAEYDKRRFFAARFLIFKL